MSNILVTGGFGFIGSNLAKRLIAKGHSVRILDNSWRGNSERLKGYLEKIKIFDGDVLDCQLIERAVEGAEIVYHFAAINGTSYFYEMPQRVLEVNVKGTINVLEASIKAGVKDFIFSSSSEVYGVPRQIPTKETQEIIIPDITNPRFSYSGSKIAGELFCINYARKNDISIRIIRYHNVYGPDMGKEHVIPQLLKKIEKHMESAKSKKIEIAIEGNGEQTRAFCYIDDAIEGTIICAQKGVRSGIYNIGNDLAEIKIKDLVRLIAKRIGLKIDIVSGPVKEGSVMRRCPDISLMRSLGYIPRIVPKEGLDKTIAWYMKGVR